jgi:predicted Zn-dependent protease
MRRPALSALALALLLAAGCASVENPVTGRTERTVMDESQEVSTGAEQHKQVLAEYGVVKDSRVQAYVNELGQKLARNSDRPNLKWTFTVLDSPEVNAFALPGGYVYVTRGIMAYMDSEADLAGVMGHEIGHVTARHGAQRATREQTAGLGVLAASVLGAVLGVGDIAQQVSQGVAAGYVARYSREQELQADQLGARYLARSGYNPRNMVDVIQLLKNQELFAAEVARSEGRQVSQAPTWLASHPTNDQRLRDIQAIVAQTAGGPYGDDGHDRYLRVVDGLAFGESAEQGVTRGRTFFHEGLGFAITAPAGWKVQNQADAVALVNPQGDAGLVLKTVPSQAGASPDEVVRTGLRIDNPRTDRYTLNGLPATHVAGLQRDERGNARPVEATVVGGPGGRTYALIYGAAEPAALERNRRQLQEAESSFRPLSAADRASARPWTLRTVALPAGGLPELARRSPLPHAEQQLRLLNGVYASGTGSALRPGQPVKAVE